MLINSTLNTTALTTSATTPNSSILEKKMLTEKQPVDMITNIFCDIEKWALFEGTGGIILFLIVALIFLYLATEYLVMAIRLCIGLIRDNNAIRRIEGPRRNAASANPSQYEICISPPVVPSSSRPIPQVPPRDVWVPILAPPEPECICPTRHACQSPLPLRNNEEVVDIFDEGVNDVFDFDNPER